MKDKVIFGCCKVRVVAALWLRVSEGGSSGLGGCGIHLVELVIDQHRELS